MASQCIRFPAQGKTQTCIWTQAGIGGHKRCRLDYECTACRYDMVMQRAADENRHLRRQGREPGGRRGQIVSWKDKLLALPPARQPCLHHMKGRIEFRACHNRYSCPDCEFDQYFDDQFTVHATLKPIHLMDIDGFKIPQGYYLHPGHTWIKIEASNTVRIGMDEFALRVLGPFDRVTPPLMGKVMEQGRRGIQLKRGNRSAHLLSPVSGVVTAANHRWRESGSKVEKTLYDRGWVARVHCDHLRRDISGLMIGAEASAFLAREVHLLYDLIEETAGALSADGGQLESDIFGKMPGLGWERLTRLFLRQTL